MPIGDSCTVAPLPGNAATDPPPRPGRPPAKLARVTDAPAPAPAPLPTPLDRRLVFVTGKGGVGKSTISAALGVLAARRGRRTIVAELARRDDVSRVLGSAGEPAPDAGRDDHRAAGNTAGRAVYSEIELPLPGTDGRLHAISVDPELAMEEYLIDQLPVRSLAERLASSRTFGYLAAATPGLSELLAMGKVWELAQPTRRTPGTDPYDLVIVDAHATGHGVALLQAPRTFAAAASVGPIARQARTIAAMIDDPARSAIVAVTDASEAAVTETLELRDALAESLGRELARVIVNGVEPRRFGPADDALLAAAQTSMARDAPSAPALRVARHAHRRATAQQRQVARLRRQLSPPPVTLPHLFVEAPGAAEIEHLAHLLEQRL
jgi:anion-transporting  ArsA/GET3 family ATPase